MLQALPHVELIRNIREADDLARVSFNGALERYIQGSSDCVFQAAFSVEMALILRLDKALTNNEKEKVKKKNGLMLSGAIDLSSKKGILMETDVEKAWKLNHLRNINAHPANSVAFIKQQYKATLDIEKEMPDVYSMMEEMRKMIVLPESKAAVYEDFSLILRSASEYVKQLMEKLPDLDWCASQDTLQFQKKRAKDYLKEISQRILTTEGIEELLENAANNVAYMQTTYPYAGRDEYEALTCAYEILKSLSII